MSTKTHALKYGRTEKDGDQEKFIHEGTLTTRSGLKINEATLEPENISKTLEGKAFILFDVDEQKEVKNGTL